MIATHMRSEKPHQALMALAVVFLLGTSSAWAIPPGGRPPTVTPQPQQPSVPNRGGGIDWGLLWGMTLEGLQQRYPQPEQYPGGIQPSPYPGRPPYTPYPSGRPTPYYPTVPPQYVQPTPQPPAAPPTVTPEPNIVIVRPPPQFSPLTDRCWEVSVREARCYGHELRVLINESLDAVMLELATGNTDLAAVKNQISQVRQLLENNVAWRDLEPQLRSLIESNRSTFSAAVNSQFEHIGRLILIRDAFLLAGRSDPRGRGVAMTISSIPTGLIWVVFDPTLAPGTALLVNGHIMVCGGGIGGIQIAFTSAAAALGLPVGSGAPVPDAEEDELSGPQDLTIISLPKDAATAVNYVLNGRHNFAIQPGQNQKLPADKTWTIQFDRGAGQGVARYALPKGHYEFRILQGRWELKKVTYEVTIDNQAGTQEFAYVLDNEVVRVKPGESKTHTSPEPLVVEFDRGEDADNPARKNLNKSGTYKVAVDTQTNYLDLFATQKTGEGEVTAS